MTPANDVDVADLLEMIARQKVADVMARYARGIDRCDIETLLSVFWPDARADYGSGEQDAGAWARATVTALKGMRRTQHSVGNLLVEFQGEQARAETYCHAFHEFEGADGPREMVVGGRYLDLLERRTCEWRISRRIYVMDWNHNGPSTCQWDEGIYAGLKIRGGRWPQDPLRAFLAGD